MFIFSPKVCILPKCGKSLLKYYLLGFVATKAILTWILMLEMGMKVNGNSIDKRLCDPIKPIE